MLYLSFLDLVSSCRRFYRQGKSPYSSGKVLYLSLFLMVLTSNAGLFKKIGAIHDMEGRIAFIRNNLEQEPIKFDRLLYLFI